MIEEALGRVVTDADSLEKLGTDTPNDLAKQAEIEVRLDVTHAALNGQVPVLFKWITWNSTEYSVIATSRGEAAQLILTSEFAVGVEKEELEKVLSSTEPTVMLFGQVHQRHTNYCRYLTESP